MKHCNERRFGPMLGHCAHLAKEQMRRGMAVYEVTPSQTSILLYLHHHGSSAQSAVTEELRVKAPTAGGLLDRMEEKGLLRRTVDEKDARRRYLTLTDKGESLVEDIRCQFDRGEAAILRGFTEDERTQLWQFLERIISNLEEPL